MIGNLAPPKWKLRGWLTQVNQARRSAGLMPHFSNFFLQTPLRQACCVLRFAQVAHLQGRRKTPSCSQWSR
jgi:hypothetical protein